MTKLFVRTAAAFENRHELIEHIGKEMLIHGVVHDTYPQALRERESVFPTGIMLDKIAIAIPHCDAIHAKQSALYVIRTVNPVLFAQADDDNEIEISLIIALIVENPNEQLKLLRRLFGELQKQEIQEEILVIPDDELEAYFRKHFL